MYYKGGSINFKSSNIEVNLYKNRKFSFSRFPNKRSMSNILTSFLEKYNTISNARSQSKALIILHACYSCCS